MKMKDLKDENERFKRQPSWKLELISPSVIMSFILFSKEKLKGNSKQLVPKMDKGTLYIMNFYFKNLDSL